MTKINVRQTYRKDKSEWTKVSMMDLHAGDVFKLTEANGDIVPGVWKAFADPKIVDDVHTIEAIEKIHYDLITINESSD